MTTIDAAVIPVALTQLKAEWPNGDWTWDDRMSMMSATVIGDKIAAGRAVAARAMTQCFDKATLAGAPAPLVELVGRYGGLRGNQCVFSDGTMFGLWWPWDGGGTVSLRIGLLDADDPRMQDVRSLFGL